MESTSIEKMPSLEELGIPEAGRWYERPDLILVVYGKEVLGDACDFSRAWRKACMHPLFPKDRREVARVSVVTLYEVPAHQRRLNDLGLKRIRHWYSSLNILFWMCIGLQALLGLWVWFSYSGFVNLKSLYLGVAVGLFCSLGLVTCLSLILSRFLEGSEVKLLLYRTRGRNEYHGRRRYATTL